MKKITFEGLSHFKNWNPKPHPMQHRIDAFRSIPSLYKLEVANFKIKLEGEYDPEVEEAEVDYDKTLSKVEEEIETDRDTIMEKIYDKL
jgi:hypothetical protein